MPFLYPCNRDLTDFDVMGRVGLSRTNFGNCILGSG